MALITRDKQIPTQVFYRRLSYVVRDASKLRYVVDVGASRGLFANFIARKNNHKSPNPSMVFAIEPIPEVASIIGARHNLVTVIGAVLPEKSISVSGAVSLNIFKNKELSSILTIKGELDKEVWGSHVLGALPIQTIEVPAFTLEQLMISNRIPYIDFLKIDSQGMDLEVLESAGRRLRDIKAVVLEVPYSKETALYESETDLSFALDRVKLLGFTPVRLVPNGGGECNLFLRNNSFTVSDYFEMEKELGLEKAPTLKIGPHNPHINRHWAVMYLFQAADVVYTLFHLIYRSIFTTWRKSSQAK
jgi:FkbM family methyltransferase